MSKKCIVQKNGNISDICEAEDAFEIYEGADAEFIWVDAPDNVSPSMRMNNGEFVATTPAAGEESKEFLRLNRMHAYGNIGEQLDMQYHDKIDGTTTWDDHVAAVKAANRAPNTGRDEATPEENEIGLRLDPPQWVKV